MFIQVNRFNKLKPERRKSAKVTDFFGSVRKIIPLRNSPEEEIKTKILDEKINDSSTAPDVEYDSLRYDLSFSESLDRITSGLTETEPEIEVSRLFGILVLIPVLITFIMTHINE